MLKSMLADLTKSFMRTDCKTIVCHPSSDKKLRVSSTTEDKQLYIYAESVNAGWEYNEFAFRDWASIAAIISSFYDSSSPESCVFKLESDEQDYPNVLKIKNGVMKMTHYLQNFTFISRQDDLLNAYKGKKFTLKQIDVNCMPEFTADTMTKISKLSALTGEKYIKVKKEGNDLYFVFGDETKTIDNGKILVQTNYTTPFTDKGLFFSVEYLGIAVNSLKDQNMKIKYDGGIITVCGSNDISNKVMAIVGKKEV